MSLTKAIEHGKEHRDPRRGGARSCDNHGGCGFCEGNRLHRRRVQEEAARQEQATEREE